MLGGRRFGGFINWTCCYGAIRVFIIVLSAVFETVDVRWGGGKYRTSEREPITSNQVIPQGCSSQ